MDEERPSNEETMVTPPDGETGAPQPEEAETKRPTGLLVGGFVLVLALIVAGLFLPPISLGQRLSGSDTTAGETAERPATEVPADAQTAVPGEFAVSVADANSAYSVAALGAADLAAANVDALPPNVTLQGNVYTVAHDAATLSGQVAVTYPDAADAQLLDLYGWNGDNWAFVPSQIDAANRQIVSQEHNLHSAFALGQTAAADTLTVSVVLLSDQTLPDEIANLTTEVAVGTLRLVGNGDLQGDVTPIAGDGVAQFVHVTNVGAVVDQASLSAFLNDATAQANQINALVNTAVSGNYAGVNLDYQGVAASQEEAFNAFVSRLADALRAQNLLLAVTLGTPQETGGNWDSGGQDWSTIGELADVVYVQMPLDPTAFGADGTADQLLAWATRQIPRHKIVMLTNANAVDRLGESFTALSNEAALENFGDLQFVQGGEEVEPDATIEVVLSGDATPLEWDGTSLTYKYSYENEGQTHHVWLGNPAALAQRLSLANQYNLRGIAARGLGDVSNSEEYAAALASVVGSDTVPETSGAAIVWTVRDQDNSVLASESGSDLSFTWEGVEEGTYTIDADFALGDTIVPLGSLSIIAAVPEPEPEPVVEEEEPEESAETTGGSNSSSAAVDPGDADGVTNTNANVRTGPGLGYGLIAGGAPAGTQLELIGRSSDSSWLQVRLPAGEEGWIFATLVTVNEAVAVSSLDVVEVDPPAAADSGGGSSGDGNGDSAPPPAPAPAPAPIGNTNFELGGQIFGSPYGMMSYAGMTWVKRQHKWSPGQSPDAVQGMISEAHNAGFKILLSIPGQLYPTSLPDFGAYTEFLRGVASLPDPPDAIEIWNEMNIEVEWPKGQINPASYVNNMLAPAYNAIKSVNPNIMVISGAPAPTGFFGGGCSASGCDDEPYMRGMAAAGAASYMDCIGIHYNEGIIPPSQRSGDPRTDHYTRYFWGMVDAYYNAFGGSRPLCFTEIGYLTPEGYGSLPGGFAWAQNTTVAEQAQWLAEAVSLSASSGKVRMFIVWNVDSTTWGSDPQAGFAIIRPGGGCPACETLRQVMGGG